jgi:hypothetical protein
MLRRRRDRDGQLLVLVRSGEIKKRPDGYDSGRIDRAVALVIVPPDMF